MPLVPGLAFTNGIRDIADGDYISGAIRMIDAVLVFCLWRQASAVAEHLSSSDRRCHAVTDLLQILAAGIGTVAFGALFGVPSKYYPYCGLIGASGWAVYVFVDADGLWSEAVVVFGDSAGYSDVPFFAVRERCPVTIFLICGILPLVPGSRNILDVLLPGDGQLDEASTRGFSALKAAVAIVLGIVFVFEIPQRFFKGKAVRKNDKL